MTPIYIRPVSRTKYRGARQEGAAFYEQHPGFKTDAGITVMVPSPITSLEELELLVEKLRREAARG